MTTPELPPQMAARLEAMERRLFQLERRPPLAADRDPRVDVLWRPARCAIVKTDTISGGIADSADTTIYFTAESYDLEGEGGGVTSGMWDPSNPPRVWIPHTDLYTISAQFPWDGTAAAGRFLMTIFRNGSVIVDRDERSGSDGTKTVYITNKLATDYPFTEGDYVEMAVRQETGAPVNILTGAGVPAYLKVRRVAPVA